MLYYHPANYKGCLVYQSLRKKLYPALRAKKLEGPTSSEFNTFINPNISFADQLKSSHKPEEKSLTQSNDIKELKDMMKQLMQQMSTMLNLLTTVVSKMT